VLRENDALVTEALERERQISRQLEATLAELNSARSAAEAPTHSKE